MDTSATGTRTDAGESALRLLDVSVLYELARTRLKESQHQEAISVFTEIITAHPLVWMPHLLRAIAYRALMQHANAHEDARRARALLEQHVAYTIARQAREHNEFAGRFKRLDAYRALAHAHEAAIYANESALHECINECDKALQLDDHCAWAYRLRAKARNASGAFFTGGDRKRAEKFAGRAIEIPSWNEWITDERARGEIVRAARERALEEERARREKQRLAEQAEREGRDYCKRCYTVNPPRCAMGRECGICNELTNGLCQPCLNILAS